MYCPNCGAQNEDTAIVCTHCGSILSSGEGPMQPPQQPAAPYPPRVSYSGGPYASEPKTNGFSIASLVLGISGFVICCMGWLLGPLAVIFGFLGNHEVKLSEGRQKGGAFALAGIILGFAAIAVFIAALIFSFPVGRSGAGNEFWKEFMQRYQSQLSQYSN